MASLIQSNLQVGSQQYNTGVQPATINTDRQGDLAVQNAGGDYEEMVARGVLFYAANQAAQAWSVGLTATYTGLVISNPLGSGKNLVMITAGFGLTVAPVAVSSIGFFGGYSAVSQVIHTTALNPGSNQIGLLTYRPAALADSSATLAGTPVWLHQFMGGFTAGALPATGPAIVDLKGMFLVPPGGYFGIGALTAVTGLASLTWAELPV